MGSAPFRRLRPTNDDERLLPLINVVLLLLILFMLAGRLDPDRPFGSEPPLSASAGPAETSATVVSVAADGRLAVDGETLERDALRAALAERVAGGRSRAVQLQADAAAEAARVVGIMALMREAGVERVELLAIPRGP